MSQKIRHLLYYAALVSVLLLGFLASREARFILILLPILYVVLALLHHAAEHTLTSKIVVEYILIGSIAMAIFAFLIVGGL